MPEALEIAFWAVFFVGFMVLTRLQPTAQQRWPSLTWGYSERTTLETLRRHHRIVMWIAYLTFFSIVSSVSALLQVVVFDLPGSMLILMISMALSCVLIVPGILAGLWVGEICRSCDQLGLPRPSHEDFVGRIRRHSLGLAFWILASFAAPWISRLLTEL